MPYLRYWTNLSSIIYMALALKTSIFQVSELQFAHNTGYTLK